MTYDVGHDTETTKPSGSQHRPDDTNHAGPELPSS